MSKDNSKTIKKVLQPNEQFSISKYERNGTELEWATVWKYKIVRVYTNNNLNSWKDYNIEGAWDLENSRYKAKGSLILEATDFLADIQ